ncbi:helix-turn-helix domain-containing protein [Polaribacter vadi]|uniref:helix-turn-helix domain-containing protein n=1 Tax=Polaribacter TaxID=52959 RepID=UPI001C08940F|nr:MULTISPECIES: helix-turn-helix domain-containing protein [Polaribacter]MBU3012324.1 helix-turn-helix domain-containing protein [Polaribacter vadi]MDO6742141.1 helix-turn-helix domain-containing protein [Polaribacter sp. 1_MG-2023]
MKKENIHIESVHEIHQSLNLGKPKHPLISVFKFGKEQRQASNENFKYSLGLYQISIKGNCPYTISKYGRNSYDFQECSMIFTAPNQVLEFNTSYQTEDDDCWTLVFHPDLIRKSELGKKIERYAFFSYGSNEALHLSDEERNTITDITQKITKEYSNNIDSHSQTLIISNLELLLNYCTRFYDRQFYIRTNLNKDVASDFEQLLKNYYKAEKHLKIGIPSVKYCADEMNMSSRYLSDLLRKETGKSTQEHIHHYIIEKAKNNLLNSKDSASEIAYKLGFEYPQYFSKMFKKNTSMSPIEYRQSMN